MIRLFNVMILLLATIAWLLMLGCHKAEPNTPEGDGVQVGNGAKELYASALYKVGLEYSRALTKRQLSPEVVQFTNEHLVRQSVHISRARMQVFPGGRIGRYHAGDKPGLDHYLKSVFPEKTFIEDRLNGLIWFRSEVSTPNRTEGSHYILTPRGDLIVFKTLVRPEGRGMELILPMVRSIFFDDLPPLVLRVQLDQSMGRPRERRLFILDAVDDRTGIAEHAWAELHFLGLPREPRCFTQVSLSLTLEPVPITQHRYVSDFAPLPGMCSGPYAMTLTVWDKAGNPRDFHFPNLGRPFRETDNYESTNGVRIRMLFLTVSPATPATDRTPPTVFSVSTVSPRVMAGENGLLRFTAEGNEHPIAAHQRFWGEFTSLAEPPIPSARIPLTGSVIHDGGHFFLPIRAHEFLPSGIYALKVFVVEDSRGNTLRLEADVPRNGNWFYQGTELSVVQLIVHNPWTADIEPPRIDALRVVPRTLKAGEGGQVIFRASDNLSGLPPYLQYAGRFMPIALPPTLRIPAIQVYGPIYLLLDGSYAMRFKVPVGTPPGRYALQFVMEDRAHNRRVLDKPPGLRLAPGLVVDYAGAEPARLPLVYLDVE